MWGDAMCTSGDVQYIREIPLVHWGDVQYIGGYHDACGGYREYIEGCSAHQRDIMMHLGEQLDKSFQFLLKTLVHQGISL